MLKRNTMVVALAALVGSALVRTASAQDNAVDFDRSPSAARALSRSQELSQQSPAVEPRTHGSQSAEQAPVQRRIVVFHKGTPADQQKSLVKSAGAMVVRDLHIINGLAIMAPSAKMEGLEKSLSSLPEVRRVENDLYQKWISADEAPRSLAQDAPWGIKRVNASGAWPATRGAGVKVAVIDTGVDYDHSDLKVSGGFNVITGGDDFKDDQGHGTHVSGTIAAQDNDFGVVGVAPDVALYGVKVLDANGSGTFSDVIAGIQWAADNKMDVANMSLGASQGTEALAEAVTAASKSGLTIVAAAGNSGASVGYPAAYPEIIAVSASDSKDKLAYFSSRGPEVDLIAPGVKVKSTTMGGDYGSMSGTSMACPHMAGLAALAVSQGAHGQKAVRKALVAAAEKLPNLGDEAQGAGMVDAAKLAR